MSRGLPTELLPRSARVGPVGLEIGGVPLADLVAEHGTPLLVVDTGEVRAQCRQALAAFPAGVSYAGKAFLCRAMARLVHDEGLGLDVASGGELSIALGAGLPGSGLTFHGNNKSDAEVAIAIAQGVGRIVVDSTEELDRIAAESARRGVKSTIVVRVNPGVQATTHASIRTGGSDSKFGVSISAGHADRLVDRIVRSGTLRFGGIHVHVGSQLAGLGDASDAVSAAAAVAARHEAAELIVGGGLKVPYLAGETAPSFADWSAAAHRAAVNGGYRGPLRAEPGRALVATAGVSAYTIGIVKDNGAGTVFVAVDGGVSDNPRPALYGARYQPLLVREPTVAPDNSGPFQVVGKNCESSDTFAERTGFAREPISGDLLAIPVTGAYTYSMASNYNGLGRPAVVFVSDERSRVVLRREELRDLVRLEAG